MKMSHVLLGAASLALCSMTAEGCEDTGAGGEAQAPENNTDAETVSTDENTDTGAQSDDTDAGETLSDDDGDDDSDD